MDPWLILFGFGVGILVGTTGMGGGSLMTPLLILVFGTKPVIAIGTDLAYAAITKTVGGWKHLRSGTVDVSLSLWMAVGSIPGALIGVGILEVLRRATDVDFDQLVLELVAIAVLVTGIATLARAILIRDAASRERDSVPMERRHKVAAIVLGVSVGTVLGLTSAGSGALIAVGLIIGFRLRPHRVVGTDVFHAGLLLWVAALAHLLTGNIDYGLMLNILIGSVPGVYVGSSLSTRAPAHVLRPMMGAVLCVAGVLLAVKAETPFAVVIAVIIALTGGLITWLWTRRATTVPGAP